jgi:hypothetical protein
VFPCALRPPANRRNSPLLALTHIGRVDDLAEDGALADQQHSDQAAASVIVIGAATPVEDFEAAMGRARALAAAAGGAEAQTRLAGRIARVSRGTPRWMGRRKGFGVGLG